MTGRGAETAPLPVGVSACLLGETVRWDGGHRRAPAILSCLGPHVAWIPVCPEVEIGLGVPREPIRLEAHGDGRRLKGVASRRDLTAAMTGCAEARVREFAERGLCGYVFKSGSPSCGPGGVPVHDGDRVVAAAPGLFAGIVAARLPGLPVAREDELATEAGCLRFLDRIRAYRASRDAARKRGS